MRNIIRNIIGYLLVRLVGMKCSGYRVHPNGYRCPGCKDCRGSDSISPYKRSNR